MTRARFHFGGAVCFLLGCVSPALAHDLWLLPPVSAQVKKPNVIKAAVGMEFPLSEFAHDTTRYRQRLLLGPDGEGTLKPAGKDDQDKTGLLEFLADKPGIYQAAVTTQPKVLTLSAEAFNDYLVADGMPHIYRLRHKEKSLDQPAKERYSKSPKTLIQVGPGVGGGWDRVLGLPLEIVPLSNPFNLTSGQTLPVRVLFQGKPLPDANLGWAMPGDGEAPRGAIRTNARGEALIPIAQPGLMSIRLTHMTRPKMAEYEWESFWTSLTFRIPEVARNQ